MPCQCQPKPLHDICLALVCVPILGLCHRSREDMEDRGCVFCHAPCASSTIGWKRMPAYSHRRAMSLYAFFRSAQFHAAGLDSLNVSCQCPRPSAFTMAISKAMRGGHPLKGPIRQRLGKDQTRTYQSICWAGLGMFANKPGASLSGLKRARSP